MALLFCFGCGYTAQEIAKLALSDGWRVRGATRSPDRAAQLDRKGIEPVIWEKHFDASSLNDSAALLISTPPDENGCPSLNAAGDVIRQQSKFLRWIGYLSTNGVYGNHNGNWVNENSALLGSSDRAKNRIAAEQSWIALGSELGVPVVIFRLPGIYGPGRSALDTVRQGRARRILKEGQVFSRAHVSDIAKVVIASLKRPHAGALFNIADDEPSPPQDVVTYACQLLGKAPPPLISFEEADLSPMARSFYADNKRVSNDLMKSALGIELQFATYRDGLNAIYKAEQETDVTAQSN